ncbi:unnamed protein product [Fusarium graminearum]|nr:unnamed protein product [Fusarium graminearum]
MSTQVCDVFPTSLIKDIKAQVKDFPVQNLDVEEFDTVSHKPLIMAIYEPIGRLQSDDCLDVLLFPQPFEYLEEFGMLKLKWAVVFIDLPLLW